MKKKILIRIGSLRHGGAEKVLVEFLKNVSQEKYEIDLLLNVYTGKYLSDIPSWISVKYINKGPLYINNNLIILPKKIYRFLYQSFIKQFPFIIYNFILNNKKYDIEFAASHGMYNEILSSPIKTSKKIIWIHNDIFYNQNFNENQIKKLFLFDKILVISDKLNMEMIKIAKNNSERSKIIKIYNPLNTNDIIKESTIFKADCFFKNNYPSFISVGTVFQQKGFDRLLNVHKRLIDNGLNNNILIVGDGIDFEKLNKLIRDLNIKNTAFMMGYIKNPYPYFLSSDYYVLSSRYEGFPTVLTEALVLKKPIIATDVSGVRDILDNGNYGLIVENSEEGIYEGMKSFIENKEIPNSYKNRINNLKLPFCLEESVKKIEKILDEI